MPMVSLPSHIKSLPGLFRSTERRWYVFFVWYNFCRVHQTLRYDARDGNRLDGPRLDCEALLTAQKSGRGNP